MKFIDRLCTGSFPKETRRQGLVAGGKPQPGEDQRLRCRKKLGGGKAQLGLEQRPRADLNRDRWIQSPECEPLHHETRYLELAALAWLVGGWPAWAGGLGALALARVGSAAAIASEQPQTGLARI